MVLKRHLTPIGKGGIARHSGMKGSVSQPLLPSGNAVQSLTSGQPNQNINDYAKMTPLANPSANSQPAVAGLGQGDWPGIGQ